MVFVDSIGIESKNIHGKRKKTVSGSIRLQLCSERYFFRYSRKSVGLCLSSCYIENLVLSYLSENLFNNLRIHTVRIENSKKISQLENKFKTYQSKRRKLKKKDGVQHNDIVKNIYPVSNSFDCDISMRFRSTTKWFGT